MSSTFIGNLITATDFLNKYSVEIPRIQRDYTYGAKTPKTEMVLENLLANIHEAQQSQKELILNFVYGCKPDLQTSGNYFQPLDGQQRLTTIFLIYYYAAKRAGATLGVTFKYATRDDTTLFCEGLRNTFVYDPVLKRKQTDSLPMSFVEQIKDSAFYLPSFDDDPSIRSMLVVLERIEQVFADFISSDPKSLWQSLQSQCQIKFFCLDIGTFSLSDDLYIKMNARGKQLTEYEIFKSKFEKYIEDNIDKDLMYRVARLMDNDYSDLLWKTMGKDKTKIDNAFVNLFVNLFQIINYRNKSGQKTLDWEKPLYDNFVCLMPSRQDIELIIDVLDAYVAMEKTNWQSSVFYKSDDVLADRSQSNKLRFFKSEVNPLVTACGVRMKNPQVVSFYALYVAYQHINNAAYFDRIRHVRNLIEYSDDELSHSDRIPTMLREIEAIMRGQISLLRSSQFNSIQFEEEKAKDLNTAYWRTLFVYEDHDLLRGSLCLFADKKFNLTDPNEQTTISTRLHTFETIFDNGSKSKDHAIRAHLLSIGDFSRQHDSSDDNRMMGCSFYSWRLLFTKNNYYPISHIMQVLDSYTPTPVALSVDNWRYYASKLDYHEATYCSYNYPGYGYLYFEDINGKPMEVWALQSSYHGESNVMWKLMNLILRRKIADKYQTSLEKYQSNHELVVADKIGIDISQEGWIITDKTPDRKMTTWLIENFGPYYYRNGLLRHTDKDYIEYIMDVINQLLVS